MALPGEGEGGGVTAELVFCYMFLYLKYSDTQSEIKIMTPVEITTSPLLFSDAAATKVRELIAEEGDERLMLRVFISGGGCSGFQYGFTFEESLGEEDTVVENQGVKLLIDPMSYQYLTGAEIDYTEGLEGAQFVIRNPNATTTCGCGSSFSV
jgi:iron-sulfur cluster insertion protein